MDRRSPPRLKLLSVFLLVSTNSVCLHGTPVTGVDHHLHCATDYLYTINCSLSIATSENYSDSNSSYWLTFIETYEKKKLVCTLTNTDEDYFCSLSTSSPIPDEDSGTFMDFDCFEISLCHSQNDGPEICEQLVDKYLPVNNITPNAPCQLTVSPDSGQHHFTWISTYEEYEDYTGLVENLKFQLHYYKRGDTRLLSHEINTNSLNYSVDDQNFEPDTKYAARVRSSPNQAHYKGQWSDWSSEVYWGTESAVNEFPSNTFVSGLGKALIPLCVLVPFLLLLPFLILFCYAPVKKWRQSTFIPTPAPYFHTLYSDFQGDFKSWVVTQEYTADMLKAEETLQIDTLTECEVVEEEEESQLQFHHQLMAGGMYSNIADPGCDTSLLGIPYTVFTMVPPSSAGSSHQSLTLSSPPGSPAERDSGCWLEKDLHRYCNEYCTMSAFQQSDPVTAEDSGSSLTKPCSCPTGLIRMEAITEA